MYKLTSATNVAVLLLGAASTGRAQAPATQPGGQLRLGQASLTPNLGQPPTKHSVQLIKLRLPVHHGLADRRILQMERQLIKPVRILTWSLVVSY